MVTIVEMCSLSDRAFSSDFLSVLKYFNCLLGNSNGRSVFDCDFESGTCSWTQSDYDTGDWKRNKGDNSTNGIGPKGDHTTGRKSIQTSIRTIFPTFCVLCISKVLIILIDIITMINYLLHIVLFSDGYYLYFDTSKPSKSGDHVDLLSPLFTLNDAGCFSFWYYINGIENGNNLSSLSIWNIWYLNNTSSSRPFNKNKSQGNQWLYGQLYLNQKTPNHSVCILFYITRNLAKKIHFTIFDTKIFQLLLAVTINLTVFIRRI